MVSQPSHGSRGRRPVLLGRRAVARRVRRPQSSPDGRRSCSTRAGRARAIFTSFSPTPAQVHRITHDSSEEIEASLVARRAMDLLRVEQDAAEPQSGECRPAGGVPTQITRQGGLTATESPDGSFLYYAKDARSPTTIWRVPVGGGHETQVVDRLSYSINFVVADRGLYSSPSVTLLSRHQSTSLISARAGGRHSCV